LVLSVSYDIVVMNITFQTVHVDLFCVCCALMDLMVRVISLLLSVGSVWWFCCYRKNGEKVGKTSSGRWHGVLKRVKNLPGI